MMTIRESAWWAVVVGFALGVGIVSLAWIFTLNVGLLIIFFLALYLVAASAGAKVFRMLDITLKDVEQ